MKKIYQNVKSHSTLPQCIFPVSLIVRCSNYYLKIDLDNRGVTAHKTNMFRFPIKCSILHIYQE